MNLFAVSYYAPPQLTPQAIQVARLLYHLDARVTLLHGRAAGGVAVDDGFDQYPDFFRHIASSLALPDPGPALRGPWHRAARRLLPGYGACPDQFRRWRRLARPAALESLAARPPDVLASFGMPMTCHLLGLDLKRATGLPWLAHFSDPWADNPFHRTSRLEHAVNAALERRVIGAADCVLFTSNRTLDLVMAKYPPAWRTRTAVLPHAWDTGNLSASAAPPPAAAPGYVIRHLGACYGARSPEPLFLALGAIAAHTPRLLDGVAFEFIGHVSPGFLASPACRSLPPGLVTVRPPVAYSACLQLARDSAALLVIDAPDPAGSVFLPSKLIDYIGAGRPVWGITPPGAAADLIGEWAGGPHACADPADAQAVARMLAARLAQLHNQGFSFHGGPCRPEVAQRFAPDRIALGLRRALEQAAVRAARQPYAAVRHADETALRR